MFVNRSAGTALCMGVLTVCCIRRPQFHPMCTGFPGTGFNDDPYHEINTMTKLFTALILTAFAFGAQAASHAGGAPMKDKAASAPAAAAKKDEAKKEEGKKDAKPAAKKEEAKK